MATIASTCRQACRHGRAVVLGQRLLSGAAATQQDRVGDHLSRLSALRRRLRDEEDSGLKLQDFSFSSEVLYGTAVPRRSRDKSGKVSWNAIQC